MVSRYLMVMIAVLAMVPAISASAADIAVIVNKNNANEVSKDLIEKIFKAEQTNWPSGANISAIDLPDGSDTRAAFSQQVLGKSVSAIKAIWSVKLFSGKAVPPKVMSSDEEVRSAVANNKNAIGYIKASSVDASVRAVLTVP